MDGPPALGREALGRHHVLTASVVEDDIETAVALERRGNDPVGAAFGGALSSLGDTHRLGYQGLTLVVQRLEQRVKQLEERR